MRKLMGAHRGRDPRSREEKAAVLTQVCRDLFEPSIREAFETDRQWRETVLALPPEGPPNIYLVEADGSLAPMRGEGRVPGPANPETAEKPIALAAMRVLAAKPSTALLVLVADQWVSKVPQVALALLPDDYRPSQDQERRDALVLFASMPGARITFMRYYRHAGARIAWEEEQVVLLEAHHRPADPWEESGQEEQA